MEKDRIEEILNKLGSEDVPSDVRQIAEKTAGRFSEEFEQKSHIQFKETIMRKKFMSLTIAAAVIIIVLLAGVPFFKGSGPAVTLAAVYEKIQLVNAFMYKMKMNMTGNIQPGMPAGEQQMEGTITISTEYGMKMDMDMNINTGGNVQKMRQQMYVLPQEKAIYMVMPEQKQYMKMEFSDDLLVRMKTQSNDPRDFLRRILNCKYTDIGKSVIDGVEVEGFETTDPAVTGGMMEDVKVTLWVDRKTELPVREEMYFKMNEQMKMDGVIEDFQWYVQVNADEFKPVIPQDYTTILPGGYKLPSGSEEEAIEGLRFCNQLLGRYPQKIDMMNLMNEVVAIKDSNKPTEAALKLKEEIQGDMNKLPEEEKAKKIMDIMRSVQSLGMFYIILVQEKKEPVYYGNVVRPNDADKVLLRWKLSETEYRVIYGNLAAETVSAEKLAELESKLPK
jgi:outer membrane lipoprotein-sorting protein